MMTGHKDDALEALLLRWAAWCYSGGVKRQECPYLRQGSSRPGMRPELPSDVFDVEAAVVALKKTNELRAAVIRFEYAPSRCSRQRDKALALNMSTRTYQRHLSEGRAFIADHLRRTPCNASSRS